MLQHWTMSSSHSHSHSASRRQFSVTMMMIVMLLGIIPHSVLPSSPPFVKDLPRHQKLILGNVNRFVLECRGDGDPRPVYTWYRGGELLTPERREELGVSLISNEEHSQLEFPSPTNIQEGFYHCEARNDLGLAVSSVTQVSSLASPPPPGTSAPVWISPPKTEIKSLGSRVELDCAAEGSPEPEVVWTKNGEVIPDETSPSLIIPSLGEEDVANYACNASNIAGYEYKNVIVNILTIGAMIKEGPKPTLIASKGSDVVLRCDAEGFPRPVITWSVNGSEISAGDKYRVDRQTGALTVIQATMEDDGRYRCVARNQAEDSAEGHLIVKSVATIVRGPSDRTETLGSEVRMECEVVADTSVSLSVTWKKDNEDLGSGASGERITVTEEDTAQSSIHRGTGTYRTTLTIRMVSVQDEGIYTCVASQGPGRVTESGLLTVVGIEPRIQLPDKSSHLVLAGSSLLLPCPVTQGVPAPDVAWYHGSDEVTRGEVGADHSLAISHVIKKDAGLYTCKASNTEGSAKIMYSLEVSRSTSIVSDPIYIDLSATAGSSAVFPCDVDMDQILRARDQQQEDQDYGDYKEQSLGSSFEVAWYKDYQELSPGFMEAALIMSETEVNSVDQGPCAQVSGEHSLYLLANSSLLVCGLGPEDVGSYHCEVNTSLGEVVRSQPSSVYLTAPFPWWIVIIAISLVIFLILICVICYCKRRRTGKGYYGMDIEDGINGGAGHNKSDIYYTTEDNESIMDEMDQSMLDKQNGKTPIFTPKTIRRLARVDKSIGSIGSLLDDDEYLDKGYDEDGSFRERYAE